MKVLPQFSENNINILNYNSTENILLTLDNKSIYKVLSTDQGIFINTNDNERKEIDFNDTTATTLKFLDGIWYCTHIDEVTKSYVINDIKSFQFETTGVLVEYKL